MVPVTGGYNRGMRTIGIITDAHANLPALSAALAAMERDGCDELIHTGDAIGIGPHPAECLELLLAQPRMRFVMGNHDEWFAHGLPEPQPAWMGDEEFQHQRWTHRQLTPALREQVAAWPDAVALDVGGVRATFCHYPREANASGNNFVPILRDPTVADLDRLFAGFAGDIVFYGHHHPHSDLQGRLRYVNPGALGCNAPGHARYAVLTVADDGAWDVSFRTVSYDVDDVLPDYEARDVPVRDVILRIFHATGPA